MKILLINNFHHIKGGADSVYFNTAKLLRENGHEVYFFSMKHPENVTYEYSHYFANSLDYRKLSTLNKFMAIPSFIFNQDAYRKLLIYLEKIKPDIAHIHLFMGGLTVAILKALKQKNIPVIHTVHDYRLICPAYTFLDRHNKICELCIDGNFIRCAIKRCSLQNSFTHSSMLAIDAYFRKYIFDPLSKIDLFIFVSHFSKNKHIIFNSKFNLKTEILYNFNLGSTERSNVRGNYILYYGRMSREKGIDILIESAIRTKTLLLLVGVGPLFEKYKNLNCENIKFLGFKKGKELSEIVNNASFIVVPSEWYENNPLTIVEAFSIGKPVIGANIGGIPELINKNNGFIFESQNVDSLTKIINEALNISNDDYEIMSQNAYEFAHNNFSEVVHYQRLINSYETLIHDKKNN